MNFSFLLTFPACRSSHFLVRLAVFCCDASAIQVPLKTENNRTKNSAMCAQVSCSFDISCNLLFFWTREHWKCNFFYQMPSPRLCPLTIYSYQRCSVHKCTLVNPWRLPLYSSTASPIRITHLVPLSLVQYTNNLHRLENCLGQVFHHSKCKALICFGSPICCARWVFSCQCG